MKTLVLLVFSVFYFTACNQKPKIETETNYPDFAEVDTTSYGQPPGEDSTVRKVVNFISDPKNKKAFSSQEFIDSLGSVKVVSVINGKKYSICYDADWHSLDIHVQPNQKNPPLGDQL